MTVNGNGAGELEIALRRLGRGDHQAMVNQSLRGLAVRATTEGLLDVAYTYVDSPFGRLLVATTPKGLVRVAYPEDDPDDVLDELAVSISPRVLRADAQLDPVARQLDQYFGGGRTHFEVDVDWRLTTDFARTILRGVTEVDYGNTTSYGDLAARVGSPGAPRAAGNALGANPMPIVVPCHRVVRADGALGGYTGGTDRKQYLLDLESALAA